METLEDKIRKFLEISYGDGYGYGYGSGYGYGYGDGDGSGDGSGDGDGYGDGYGDGSGDGSGDGDGDGDGDGLKTFNGHKEYRIDGVQTIIYSVHGNMAQGAIIESDLTLKPCYIAKEGNCFAHGETAHQAALDAHGKYLRNIPEEERIQAFVDAHPSLEDKYPASDLFEWHNALTGSCRMGRESFCRERGIDVEKDSFTIGEFVKLTENSYGGEVVRKLLASY